MRIPLVLVAVLSFAGSAAEPVADVPAPGASRAAVKAGSVFVNHQVSARTTALNQAVRVEFVTGGRQIERVDIPAAVAAGLALSTGRTWRLLGRPAVSEGERIRTVQVSFSLLPRVPGDHALPRFPLTWLSGEPTPDFGRVQVEAAVRIGSESRPLPAELEGVAGFPWGSRLDDLRAGALREAPAETRAGAVWVRPRAGLELCFRQGELAEARVTAPGLALDQALASFAERWGQPQGGEAGAPAWLLGWVRIAAGAAPEGVVLHLAREDALARADAAEVRGKLFSVLEGGR